METLSVLEGEPFAIPPGIRPALVRAVQATEERLRPRFRILTETNGVATMSGVVGTITLGAGQLLHVTPKTEPGDDWIASVLDLIIGTDRLDAAGERRASVVSARRNILEALAMLFALRLERAVRREGPILLLERQTALSGTMKGRLDVTAWSRRAAWEPHRLPVAFNGLSAENDFSKALATAAQLLARATGSQQLRARLRSLAAALRPGLAPEVMLPPNAIRRTLPSQWAGYGPAWSIAKTVLSNRSPLGAAGREQGVSIAIEAWPLMERLLERTMVAAVGRARTAGFGWVAEPKTWMPLLTPLSADGRPHSVEPDGRITAGGRTIVTLEAKYKKRHGMSEFPRRSDIYQALTTASSCRSPVSVLVYPEKFPPIVWNVTGFEGRPVQMIAIGLGLFSYRAGVGDEERGEMLFNAVRDSMRVGVDALERDRVS